MLNYKEFFAVAPQLKPYIESYLHIEGKGGIPSKSILPRPGASLAFDFSGKLYNDTELLHVSVGGFHAQPYRISSNSDHTDCVVVKFTAFGLSRFTAIPMHVLTNQVIDATHVFGNALSSLFHQMQGSSTRIALLEKFLLQYFQAPSNTDTAIFNMATAISLQEEIRMQDVPLSIRQTERRFKHLVGVDLQTYIRVCRFDKAKSLLRYANPSRLTDVAYDANYFDQAHFSNEFKRLTGVRPSKYNACGDAMFADAKPKDVVLIQF